MKKRVWLSGLFASLMVFTSACGSSGSTDGSAPTTGDASSQPQEELVVVGWGGLANDAQREAIFKPFELKYNVKIKEVTPTDYGKLKAMVQSGNVEWDVVEVDSDFVLRGAREGLLEPLDYNVISKEGHVKELVHEYGIGAMLYYIPIAYNTDTFTAENHPRTWQEFWDVEKFPGNRTLYNLPIPTLEQALLADGVEPDKLYPLDVDRAFRSLDKIKKHVSVWWSQGNQPRQLLTSGEAVLATSWNGRIVAGKEEGAPVDLEYNQAFAMSDSWVVPKGTKKKELAMKFIAFASEAEQQANYSKRIANAPTNEKALDLLDSETKVKIGASSDIIKNRVFIDYKWWDENYDKVNERFQQWLLEP